MTRREIAHDAFMKAFLVRKLPVVNGERQTLNVEAARDFQNARTLGRQGCKARTLWLLRWQSEDAYLTAKNP
jgi:hypothetical protein